MQQLFKRMLSVLLAAAVLLSLTVTAFAADGGADTALTAADYAAADALFDALDGVEQEAVRRDASTDGRTQAICDYLNAQDTVVSGSVETSGDQITWMTEQGIACAYSPRLEQIAAAAESTADDTPDVQTRTYAARGTQHGRDVYLFQPYYGIDRSFTEQYQKEAQRVAQASEGAYHYYKGEAATIDAIADAITDGGLVIFDSHGSTDYENGEDYTSGATTSYLCLQTGDGLTKADYVDGHAVYSSSSSSMKYFLVDGTVIADHMDADAQANNGLLWMAICLGMATDGLEKPLMDRGLGVVYGYSQSVTFVGDYTFEAAFFDSLLGGSTVAEAVRDMKTVCGAWDCSPQICQANGMPANYQMTTLEAAQRGRAAFPVVVSADDTYPGHGNVDALQNVNSGWALLDRYALMADTDTPEYGSVTQRGMTITANANTGYYASGYTVTPEGAATVRQDGDTFRVSALRQDCKVTIHFAAKTPATVHFSVPGGVTQSDAAGYIGDPITLPQPTGTPTADAQDYHFVGWTTEPVKIPVVSMQVLRAGERYDVTSAETTLYALYQYFATPDGRTPAFSAVTADTDDWSGTYVLRGGDSVLRCDGAVYGAALGSAAAAVPLANTGITVDADGNVSGVSGTYTVQITRVAGTEQYTIRLGGAMSSIYLACRSNSDQLNSAVDGGSSYARWLISWQDGHVVIQNARYMARSLQFCADKQYFRCVRGTETPLTLYRGEDSGLWYTTLLQSAHVHQYVESACQAATCTEPGWVEYACTACGSTYRDTLNPLGHAFHDKASAVCAQAATCTEPAQYFVQCDRCDAVSETLTVVAGDPLGHAFHDKASAVCAQAATCTEPAQYFVQCDRCDAVSETLTVAAGDSLGHSYDRNGACVRCGALMPVTPFDDVPEDTYYNDAVYWAVRRGITSGVGGNRFAPDETCTRAQIVTFLWNVAGNPEPKSLTVPFADVSADAYYYKALCWATENEITYGTSDTTFSPDGIVTRSQAVALMWRVAGSPDASADETFTDVPADAYYAAAVRWAVANDITAGTGGNRFSPLAPCTRAQIVALLYNQLHA